MTHKVHTLSQLERTLYHKYTKLREAIKCELVITHQKVSGSPSALTQHNTCLPYRSKESAPITEVSPCFQPFILLKCTGVQERKSVVCNQRSSCAISGLHSKGGERWHNYIALFCGPSSVNAACVMPGKSCQPCF